MDLAVANKCSRCFKSVCCTYTTEALGSMRSMADFQHLLWQVSHAHVEAYKDSDGWFLLIRGSCEHLRDDGACGIYEIRPQVCRDYANDCCEFDSPAEEHFQLPKFIGTKAFITTIEQCCHNSFFRSLCLGPRET